MYIYIYTHPHRYLDISSILMQTQRLAVTLLEHLLLRVRSHLAQGELARVALTGLKFLFEPDVWAEW